jgi:DNA-nicking Smr family endonuclease
LKSEHNPTKRHRGSSPPFQERDQGYHDWMKDIKSIGQDPDNISETQAQRQQRYQKERSIDQNHDVPHGNSVKAEQKSFDETASQQDKDDEASWQDDGGEGG